MRLGNKYKILLVLFIVLAVYYPAIWGPIISVDDVYILDAFGVNGNLTLNDVLRPGRGFYYRPLIDLSFFLDYHLWLQDTSFMHLENVLLHIINTILVFLIASKIVAKSNSAMPNLPLLSALLFALHPINTEAVSWIAGRTDPMATVFVLLATYFLLKCLEENAHGYLVCSMAFMVMGALAKEISLLFLPASFLIVRAWPKRPFDSIQTYSKHNKNVLMILSCSAIALCVIVSLHLLLRKGDNSISMIFGGSDYTIYDTLKVAFTTLGFYTKKLFYPLPLNFAISSIDGHYLWLGLIVFAGFIFMAAQRNIFSAFLGSSLLFIAPALIVALIKMTWTPVAERYLYLPSAFFAIGLIGCGYKIMTTVGRGAWVTPGIFLLLVPVTLVTTQRIGTWHSNLSLLMDTAEKSPGFGPIRNELGVELLKRGKKEEAAEQFRIAETLNISSAVNRVVKLNLFVRNLDDKTPVEARKILLQAVKDKKSADPELLKLLKGYDEQILKTTVDIRQIFPIVEEIIEINDVLYTKRKDVFCLYRNGQLSLMLGRKKRAAEYFNKVNDLAPETAYYKIASKKIAEQLEKE